jgi:hypothetical protein
MQAREACPGLHGRRLEGRRNVQDYVRCDYGRRRVNPPEENSNKDAINEDASDTAVRLEEPALVSRLV